MLARLHSVTLVGIEGIICEVEVDVARGGFEKSLIVGLPDTAVKESTERVKSAIINSGYKYPKTQSLINLAPADVKKAGPAFDLPIALGMLIGQGALVGSALKDFVIVGELALDGRVRPVNGVLNMAMTADAKGFGRMIVPLENAREAAVVQDLEVYAVGSLAQAAAFLSGQLSLETTTVDIDDLFSEASAYELDFGDVKGQENVKRALTVAAAGAHNIMMIGPPGAGKTMLAQRLATILPPLSLEDRFRPPAFIPPSASWIRTRPCWPPVPSECPTTQPAAPPSSAAELPPAPENCHSHTSESCSSTNSPSFPDTSSR
jgi:magnesium chelatase family protein